MKGTALRSIIVSAFIFLIAFIYRFPALQANHPFWVDEFSTAVQARRLLTLPFSEYLSNPWLLEHENIIPHVLAALSQQFFGPTEFSVRLPFVIIGCLLPIAVYFFLRELASIRIAIVGALLTAFSYLQIAWSLQARGYELQQLLLITGLIWLVRVMKNPKMIVNWIALAVTLFLGLLTHKLFIFFIASVFVSISISFLWKNNKRLLQWQHFKKLLLVGLVVCALIFRFSISAANMYWGDGLLSLSNNFWYYHAFLWRENILISFLGISGLFFLARKNTPIFLSVSSFLLLQFLFVNFLFSHYMSKYALNVYFLLLVVSALSLEHFAHQLAQQLPKKLGKWKERTLLPIFPLLTTMAIIANGGNFVRIPQNYYSVNSQMRDVAVLDYHAVYTRIRAGIQEKPGTVVVETWLDRERWYLGDAYQHIALFRWENAGPHRKTNFAVNSEGLRYVPRSGVVDAYYVGSTDDLKALMNKFHSGFLWIDDSQLPQDVIAFARQHLTEEMHLETYLPEVQENPYSVWPATLYSWGFEASTKGSSL